MRSVDLKNFEIRTDLVTDLIDKTDNVCVKEDIYLENEIRVSNIEIDEDTGLLINKKPGFYTTIYFNDITDHTNFNNLKKVFSRELKKILDREKLLNKYVLVIGLGNEKSTPDALGPKTINEVIVTKHIYDLVGSLEKGYSLVSSFAPGVMGVNGFETSDLIKSLVDKIKPDYIIVIDSLASSSIDRVSKTIQITNTGISPGSGVNNERRELSYETLGIPVITLGIPMVVDAVTIVSDTISYMQKHFSYNLKYKSKSDNLIPSYKKNYLNYDNLNLSKEENNYFLGALGNLSEIEKKSLIFDVLTPIGYNFIVTLKEIDFLVDNLSKLLGEGINNTLHDIK